jgi:hypothetical protein
MAKHTVFVLGNPLLEEDSLPLRLLPGLREAFPAVEFREIDPTEDLRVLGRRPILIDTVVGPKDVVVLNGTERVEDGPKCSMHDMDLGMSLKLMTKAGMIDSVTIIGVPAAMKEKEALEKTKRILPNELRMYWE